MLRLGLVIGVGISAVCASEPSENFWSDQSGSYHASNKNKSFVQKQVNPMHDELDIEMFHTLRKLPRSVSDHLLGTRGFLRPVDDDGDDHSVSELVRKFEILFDSSTPERVEMKDDESSVMAKIKRFENLFVQPPTSSTYSNKITPEIIQKEIRRIESSGGWSQAKKNTNDIPKNPDEQGDKKTRE